jgi:hypothetical protein
MQQAQQDKHGSQAGDVGLERDKLWARDRADWAQRNTTSSCLGPQQMSSVCVYVFSPDEYLLRV